MWTIGKVAQHAGVSVDTVRFYERERLLAPAGRDAGSGYRQYGDEALLRLRFIRQAQQSGFSLAEIRELLELRDRPEACCGDVRQRAIGKKLQLEHKILALRAMSEALSELIRRCPEAAAPLGDCPILQALGTGIADAGAPAAGSSGART